MLGYQSSADWAVPVFVRLCLSLFGCACLCSAVPVHIGLCLSLLRCAYLYWAVPVFVGLCLSVLGCACLCWAVPVFVMLCLIEFSCAGPCVCLCCLETEYWPWFPFITNGCAKSSRAPLVPWISCCHFFPEIFFRVTRDGLSERRTTGLRPFLKRNIFMIQPFEQLIKLVSSLI